MYITMNEAIEGHSADCVSGNVGPEWSGCACEDDSGWICDECEGFIPVEPKA